MLRSISGIPCRCLRVSRCALAPFTNVTDRVQNKLSSLFIPATSVPSRGMRGVQSKVLHKEVIDSFRLKQMQQLQQEFQQKTQREQLTCPSSDVDMPVPGLENPYAKPAAKCILCTQNVELDYKNTRLLSQFVSPHTGRIYGRQITGLCLFMQRYVAKLVKRSRYFGFMPYMHKDPRYMKDPKLFDPFRRK